MGKIEEKIKEVAKGFLVALGVPPMLASAIVEIAWFASTTAATVAVTDAILSSKYKSLNEESQGRLINTRQATGPMQYIYGKVRKGGNIVNIATEGTSNKFLHMIVALAGHEVNSIGDIYVNDQIVTLDGDGFVTSDPWKSKIRITKYKGDQTAGPSDWPVENVGVGYGIAYLHIRLEYNKDVFADGVPQITSVIEGKKVYDPRDSNQDANDASTWVYSANSALCIADYLLADYGLGDTGYSRIDDTKLQVAANKCDEDIYLTSGGTEKTYECHGVIDASNTPADNIGRMLTSCNGTLYWGSGKWQIIVAQYTTPIKTLTLDDFRSDISVSTRASAKDNYNIVQGTLIDAAQDYISVDFPQIKWPEFLFEDNNVENALDLSLPFTTSVPMAQRLAKQNLFRNREQITVSSTFGLSAFDLEVGDIVRLTIDRYGWDEKEFIVSSWAIEANPDVGSVEVGMSLKEISSAAFSWSAEETDIISNNTNLPKFNDPVTFGFSPVLEEVSYSENLQRDLVLTVTSSNLERIEQIEVELQRANDETGALDATGLINRELVIEGLAGSDDVFSTELIGSRKIGDFNADGNVLEADVDDYADYYYGVLSNSTKLSRIGELHEYMLERPEQFSKYIYSNIKVSTDYQTVAVGKPPIVRFQNISGGRYNIRLTPITKLGFRGEPIVHPNFEVPFSDLSSSAPTNGSVSVNDISSVQLYWTPPESQTLSHYEIRHTDIVDGATVNAGSFVAGLHYKIKTVGTTDFTAIGAASNTVGEEFWCHSDESASADYDANGTGTGTATNVVYIDKTVPWVEKVARPANNVVAATKSGTYVVRAFSKAGTPSINYLRLPLTSGELSNPYTNSTTVTRWASNSISFSTYSIEVFASRPSATGTYLQPANYKGKIVIWGYSSHPDLFGGSDVDLGTSKEARVTFDYDFVRINLDSKTSRTVDNVFGLWDNLGMLVDDINDEIQADFQIIPYMDVDGSGFKRVTSNIVKGRYFRFKIEVLSKAYNAGPTFRDISSLNEAITGLWEWTGGITCKVEY